METKENIITLSLGKTKNGEAILTSENFGDFAEKKIQEYNESPIPKNNKGNPMYAKITRTKIRAILDLVNKVYNRVMYLDSETLTSEQVADIAYIKVKIAYEAGRDAGVKDFIEATGLMKPINSILNRKQKADFLLYARYVESLVAYFKYYGGKDN